MIKMRDIPQSIDDIIKLTNPFPKDNTEVVNKVLDVLEKRGHYSPNYSVSRLRGYGIAAFPSKEGGTTADGWLVFIPKDKYLG